LALPGPRILHERLVEHLDVGAAGVDEVETFQGDLALGALSDRFHEMPRW
jgi:hypothetical protein